MVAEFAVEHTARVAFLLDALNGTAAPMPLVRCAECLATGVRVQIILSPFCFALSRLPQARFVAVMLLCQYRFHSVSSMPYKRLVKLHGISFC